MNKIFVWDSAFLTHIPSVDEQHERLVAMLNELGTQVLSAEGMMFADFKCLSNRLLEYADVHFQDEEAHMKRVGVDPRHFNEHRQAHQAFLSEMLSLGGVSEGELVERLPQVLEFSMAWLAYHILGIDQSMARQMRAINSGHSPAQAFENEAYYRTSSSEPLLGALTRLFHLVSTRNCELRMLNSELERRVEQRTAELESANESLQLANFRDDLTGVYNRRFALTKLQALVGEARRNGGALSILMLDADRFKSINDRFGHAVGDEVLKELARRLTAAVRSNDFVCRLGGDEFLIICPGSTREGTELVATRILVSQATFHAPDGVKCWDGSLSIGVTEFSQGMIVPEDLLKSADEAMYAAKRQGGGRVRGIGSKPQPLLGAPDPQAS